MDKADKKRRLIIVDDDPDTGIFMSRKLKAEAPDYDTTVLKSGQECLGCLEKSLADCILSDYQMPGMDGMELLRAVRGRGLDIPFIFITGQGNEELAREAFKGGAYDYFTKEVGFAHFPRLANSIDQAVRARETECMRRTAELELLEQKARFLDFAQSMDDAFFIITPDNSRVLYMSPAFSRIWGVPVISVLKDPLSWTGYVHEDDRARVGSEVAKDPGLKGPREMEFRIERPDGGLRWVRSRWYPVLDDEGGLSRICGSFEDITDIKELQKHRSDMYAMIRHDIMSPLTVIRGNADSISVATGETSSRQVRSILNNIDRITGFLDGLVTMSRLDEGRMSLREEPVDPQILVLEAVVDFKETSSEKGVALSWSVVDDLPKLVMDRNYALRALGNLIRNAVNYTDPGGKVKVSAETAGQKGAGYVRFSVSDTGMGVLPEERANIFDKYYRSERAAGVRGTGLGLAIVKAVAEAHDGYVELVSEPGKGSVFSMFIPADR